MSTTTDIRAALQAVLVAITPSIGVVHDYERWAADWKRFLDLLKEPDAPRLRAWTITRAASEGRRGAPGEGLRWPTYVIRGYRALDDAAASDLAFDADVERVQDALGSQTRLGGLVDHVDEPQVRVIEPRMFGAVLCHYAEISQRMHVTKSYTLDS